MVLGGALRIRQLFSQPREVLREHATLNEEKLQGGFAGVGDSHGDQDSLP